MKTEEMWTLEKGDPVTVSATCFAGIYGDFYGPPHIAPKTTPGHGQAARCIFRQKNPEPVTMLFIGWTWLSIGIYTYKYREPGELKTECRVKVARCIIPTGQRYLTALTVLPEDMELENEIQKEAAKLHADFLEVADAIRAELKPVVDKLEEIAERLGISDSLEIPRGFLIYANEPPERDNE